VFVGIGVLLGVGGTVVVKVGIGGARTAMLPLLPVTPLMSPCTSAAPATFARV